MRLPSVSSSRSAGLGSSLTLGMTGLLRRQRDKRGSSPLENHLSFPLDNKYPVIPNAVTLGVTK
jgi:hypothetical protein